VIDQKFATGFALGLLAKDVKIAADLALDVHQDAPLAQLVKDRWALARDRLGYARDNSEAIRAWDQDIRE
jgi:3-hydroxyisobutyrate dehydrogenase